MTCREIADFLFDYLEGDLPLDVRARFEHHLSLCANCRAYLATYRATVGLARAAMTAPTQPDAPPELVSAIMDSLRG